MPRQREWADLFFYYLNWMDESNFQKSLSRLCSIALYSTVPSDRGITASILATQIGLCHWLVALG